MPEPIGSIIAYAGEITSQWEKDNGWLLCNGRPLGQTGDTAALFGAIRFAWGMTGIGPNAKFNLPDLRGYFLRGVDASQDRAVDKDSNARFARHNGNVGPKVGSFQSFATALPQGKDREFKTRSQGATKLQGEHRHELEFQLDAARMVNGTDNTVAYPGRPTDAPTRLDGRHVHDITDGGDLETRPVNAYVNWIIRFK